MSTNVSAKKVKYEEKVFQLLKTYDKGFIVHADNVGSKQFQDIRYALRSLDTVILMGKNTLMKKCIRNYIEKTGESKWESMLEELVGNVGICFTTAVLTELRDKIAEFKVPAMARPGLVAPCSVTIPAGPTGMDPSQTTFFQTLNIATKINKGSIEIIETQEVVTEGKKVGASEATLLQKLGIKPFSYGLVLLKVFESGSSYVPAVLDLTDEDLIKGIQTGISQVAMFSLGANYPTIVSLPHTIINAYKTVLAVAVATEYTFPFAEKCKAYLADPSAFVCEAAPVAAAAGAPAAAAAKAPEPEAEEEEEEDMGFDLFD
jgi:large subunit ribosomal protein LP0